MEQSAAYLIYQNDYSFEKDLFLINQQFKTFESLPTRRLISFNNQQQPLK
jgi:hypothetical protein